MENMREHRDHDLEGQVDLRVETWRQLTLHLDDVGHAARPLQAAHGRL
jgi:hypothetical protein